MANLAGNCRVSALTFVNPAYCEINAQQIVKLTKFAISGDLPVV